MEDRTRHTFWFPTRRTRDDEPFAVRYAAAVTWPATLCTALALWATSAATATPVPDAHLPIVERAVAFHGGPLYELSETTLTIASANGSFDVRVRREGGLFELEVHGRMDDGTPRRALLTNDAVREWRGGEELALDAEGAARTRRFVQARVWFPFLPYGLLGDAVRHHDQGLERWGERTLHRVKVTFETAPGAPPADEYAFWFDPASGRLEQYAYAYDRGTPAGGLRFRPTTNHRRVGGILFHDVRNLGLDQRPDASVDLVDPGTAAGFATISEVTVTGVAVRELATP